MRALQGRWRQQRSDLVDGHPTAGASRACSTKLAFPSVSSGHPLPGEPRLGCSPRKVVGEAGVEAGSSGRRASQSKSFTRMTGAWRGLLTLAARAPANIARPISRRACHAMSYRGERRLARLAPGNGARPNAVPIRPMTVRVRERLVRDLGAARSTRAARPTAHRGIRRAAGPVSSSGRCSVCISCPSRRGRGRCAAPCPTRRKRFRRRRPSRRRTRRRAVPRQGGQAA